MEIEVEDKDGGLESVEIKRSKYQILSLDLRERCQQTNKLPFGRLEKMKNPVYFRMIKDGRFVGFKRIVTEYLPAGSSRWQLTLVKHNPEETQRLSRPAMGIESLKRERIITIKKRPAKKEESANENKSDIPASALGINDRPGVQDD